MRAVEGGSAPRGLPSATSASLGERLSSWGYGSLVQREEQRDLLLQGQPPLSDEQKEQAVPLFLALRQLKTQQAVQQWLQVEGLSEADLICRAERQLRWQLLCEQRFKGQASTLFLKRKSQLDRVSYSLLWIPEEGLAHELFLQLSEGERKLEQIAAEMNAAKPAIPSGQHGPVPLGEVPEVLRELLRVSAPGKLWPPKQAEGGWCIVRMEQLLPVVFNQGLKQQLVLELGEEWLQRELQPADDAKAA